MSRSPERRASPQPSTEAADSAIEPQAMASKADQPPSPARSDKSSDSEGKPVREKLKETRIDAQASSDQARGSDQPMNDAPNGADITIAGDQSTSGSENGRGRLRRKRSHEDFEDDTDKPSGKKIERHARKKSRDVTSPAPAIEGPANSLKSSVSRIDEHDGDETMAAADPPEKSEDSRTNGPATPKAGASDKEAATVTSPQNKRTHEQTRSEEEAGPKETSISSRDASIANNIGEEPHPKRHRERGLVHPSTEAQESTTKIPPSSGFANTSAASPFSALSPKSNTSSATDKTAQDLPQTSDDKFKSSGFGSFASSSASPFGGLGKSDSKSPFAAATSGNKVTSFASPTSTSSAGGGFAALGASSNKSVFGGGSAASSGGSVFGGSLGSSGFGGIGGTKAGISSFATPGTSAITGLSQKPARPFGAVGDHEVEDEESNDEGDNEDSPENDEAGTSKQTDSEKRPFQPAPLETGEENEIPLWTGRAKLYSLVGEGTNKGWQERGVGPFKFNITRDAPKKARFVLRADGTHRLLLNAAVTTTFAIGDAKAAKPTDGKLFFTTPTADGGIESHTLKMKPERAAELYDEVQRVKEDEL